MSFESEMKRKEVDTAFDAERYNKEFANDVSTNQFLLEQADKKRAMDDATSQYFLDRDLERKVSESKTSQYLLEQELQRIEKSKSKKYADLDSSIEELLKKYPSLDLKDFSQILQQQSSEQFIQRFSKEELEELIKIYLKGINNNGRRR